MSDVDVIFVSGYAESNRAWHRSRNVTQVSHAGSAILTGSFSEGVLEHSAVVGRVSRPLCSGSVEVQCECTGYGSCGAGHGGLLVYLMPVQEVTKTRLSFVRSNLSVQIRNYETRSEEK